MGGSTDLYCIVYDLYTLTWSIFFVISPVAVDVVADDVAAWSVVGAPGAGTGIPGCFFLFSLALVELLPRSLVKGRKAGCPIMYLLSGSGTWIPFREEESRQLEIVRRDFAGNIRESPTSSVCMFSTRQQRARPVAQRVQFSRWTYFFFPPVSAFWPQRISRARDW